MPAIRGTEDLRDRLAARGTRCGLTVPKAGLEIQNVNFHIFSYAGSVRQADGGIVTNR
jgi:hypothetical protein